MEDIKTDKKEIISKERMIGLFEKNRDDLFRSDSPSMARIRKEAMEKFTELGFPTSKLEAWKNTDLKATLEKEYGYNFHPVTGVDVQKVFHCDIPHLDTAIIAQLNGWYVSKDVPLMELGNGMILGSLAEAFKKYPQIIEKHYGKYAGSDTSGLTALNTAFAQDGIFIYVPDHVSSQKTIQMVNVMYHPDSIFLQSRNLIILGKNSRLSLVHCDDSYNHQSSFANIVTEVFVGEDSVLDHYKLQNLNNESTLISSVYFNLEQAATLESHFLSFNGGLLRNNTRILFNGKGGKADVNGLYLMDRKQHIDNHVFVDHAYPECTSSEHFKGILDENATGVFNGHVLVRRNAQKTNAYQGNKNILLTDTARVNSKPFLEIYADDVKCAHGSATGQLDSEAMFYLRQRGISEENARMLLMYAFANELVSKISIEPLRVRIEDMVKKRLQGELQICEHCVLHCNTPEQPMEFDIDITKI
jgi:Fe-S cluster assembly protein SufD